MSDADAYMALALNNAQGELHPLEVGMHALNSGLTGRDYAKASGMHEASLSERVRAARVAEAVMDVHNDMTRQWQHLSAIHAAPRWLWSALVARLVATEWSAAT